MSILLFSLRGVPEDEADEIRELLTKNNLEYYETSAGNWGISMPAIWLKNPNDINTAQHLLGEYHHHRAVTQREIYNQLKKTRQNKRLIHSIRENPLRFISYLAAISFILYICVKIIFEFGF